MQSTALTGLLAWKSLWSELGLAGKPAPWHARLVSAYQDPSRHYLGNWRVGVGLSILVDIGVKPSVLMSLAVSDRW